MSISFSGVASGLPVDEWISALVAIKQTTVDRYYNEKYTIEDQQSSLNSIESKFSSFRSSIEKLTDSNMIDAFDIFGRRSATSTDDAIATATTTNKASVQSIDLIVNSLATVSTAQSINSPGAGIDGSTAIVDLGNNSGTEGTFSFYVNNKKYEYSVFNDVDYDYDKKDENGKDFDDGITEKTTLQDIINSINADFTQNGEVTASIVDGKFKLEIDNDKVTDFKYGSTTDTSNFFNVLQIKTYANNEEDPLSSTNIGYLQSENILSSINTSGKIIGNQTNLVTEITTGTFKIGDAEFTIDENTTLSDLIAEINRDEDSGIVVRFDARTNKLNLTAKNPGALTINMENGTSNFLEVMGLTDENGNIADGSQTLGKNAVVKINGNTIEASGNTITEDITGINGVTIKLNAISSSNTKEGEKVTINVKQDTDELINAVKSMISTYNSLISAVDVNTGTDGELYGEYSLVRIRNDIRSISTTAVSGLDQYNSLASIGISTGDPGQSASFVTSNLSLNEATFLEALEKNPSQVRSLLIGDKNAGITGIMQNLETKVETQLDRQYGYFATRENTMNSQISSIEKSIERQEDYLESYKQRLTAQFTAMDTRIAQLQYQSSALSMF
ncbi:MAG: flagellar filament capping protein FliD [Candidatus Gastranaerophilales bacterium]|nr:flagellar filament capping protein FliD [Candidatus Gastranaerophilales bacterium]